jgi:hypothetical protein
MVLRSYMPKTIYITIKKIFKLKIIFSFVYQTARQKILNAKQSAYIMA